MNSICRVRFGVVSNPHRRRVEERKKRAKKKLRSRKLNAVVDVVQLPNCVEGECVAAATKSFKIYVVNSPLGRKQHQQRAIKTSLNETKIPKPKE